VNCTLNIATFEGTALDKYALKTALGKKGFHLSQKMEMIGKSIITETESIEFSKHPLSCMSCHVI